MHRYVYAIAIGSNRRHQRYGSPERIIAEAGAALAGAGLAIVASARITKTPALGPGGRNYANSAILLESADEPPTLLKRLKQVEVSFGRRRGKRWGPRVLDIDIILWSGGRWASRRLNIPHRAFRSRRFVLDPLTEIAPLWRDPLTGRTVRQLRAHAQKRKPVDPIRPGA